MTQDQFEVLYERYCEAVLSKDELEEFKAALRNPVFAHQFVKFSMLETIVVDELRLAEQKEAVPATGMARPISAQKSQAPTTVTSKAPRIVFTHRTYWGLGIAAMFALMVLGGYLKFTAVPQTVIIAESLEVSLQRGTENVSASSGTSLKAGDVLIVGAKGKLGFKYTDGTTVDVGPRSTLSVQTRDDAKRLVLTRGELTASVAKQLEHKPLTISTPHSEATVLGTELNVQAAEFNLATER